MGIKKLKIVLACAGGMSTELFCRKIIAYAEEKGFECECRAYGVMGLTDGILKDSNLLLLAPQVRFYKDEIHGKFPYVNIEPISMIDYGRVNAAGVFDEASAKYSW